MDAAQPALCAQAEQCVLRQLAQTSKVNAPQVAQGATDTPAAEDDMAAEMLGRQRDSLHALLCVVQYEKREEALN
jgi:hypothetical protein